MYGGTKGEMERLLKDAEALSGIKYDINNLNDVYSAINVIQTELGITGTTSKEAEETISGSVNAMKSAYENFVVGLADQNANIEDLIQNLIDSAITVLDNVMPIIQQFLDSLIAVIPEFLEFIVQYLPELLDMGVQLLESLATGILEALPQLIDTGLRIVNTLIEKFLEMLPEIIKVGIEILTSLILGIAESLPDMIPVIVDTILLIVDTLLDNIDFIIDAGIALLIGLADGLIEALPKLIDKIPVIIDKLIAAIVNNLPKIIQAGIELNLKLAEGLIKAIPQLLSKIPQIITSLVNAFKNFDWLGVGKDIIRGIGDGIGKMANFAVDAAKNVAKNIFGGIKGFFGIKSPSRLMRDAIGKMIPQGLAIGIEADTDEAVNAVDEMNKQIMKANDPDLLNMMDGRPTFSTQDNMNQQAQNNYGMSAKFDRLVELFENTMNNLVNPNYQVVMNDGALVGSLRPKMDVALGNEQNLKERGM